MEFKAGTYLKLTDTSHEKVSHVDIYYINMVGNSYLELQNIVSGVYYSFSKQQLSDLDKSYLKVSVPTISEILHHLCLKVNDNVVFRENGKTYYGYIKSIGDYYVGFFSYENESYTSVFPHCLEKNNKQVVNLSLVPTLYHGYDKSVLDRIKNTIEKEYKDITVVIK